MSRDSPSSYLNDIDKKEYCAKFYVKGSGGSGVRRITPINHWYNYNFLISIFPDFGYGGRATVEAKGLNPAGDLNEREYNVNQVREENSF